MKQTMIVISDYIEGAPVVASVRYAGLMKHFMEQYRLIIVNDRKYGPAPSRFAAVNYKYDTPSSTFTQTMVGGEPSGRGIKQLIEGVLRNKWTITAWRNYKYSSYAFRRMNIRLFRELDACLEQNELSAVFLTIPDVYGLYIIDHIKRKAPGIPVVIEIRDIINHNIGEGQPRQAYRRAERMIPRLADAIVAVSQGIRQHYELEQERPSIRLIRNGYDEEPFRNCVYQRISDNVRELTMAHIGSIYKGRNIHALIEGLQLFHERTGIRIKLKVAGLLDQQAARDLSNVNMTGDGVTVEIVGSVRHEAAASLLKEADVAVILTHTKGSDYAIPGKTYEYIGACKPILAVTADRELVELVHGRYGICAGHHRDSVADGLADLIAREFDFSGRSAFSRTNQAVQILAMIGERIRGATQKRVKRV
ncbi:hypothetical protein M3647_07125 [Paenibacillus cellulositrophicus]|uniref:hypothetical protein n=1 Tax=Paenibacillus cellulositrophicus TaxID=562959 RepID=UPI00204252D3|nr:hypothetical protein [Paenibacillus cellulositrophicus]MCM2997238.1 hypothetical protein [Paenibacillus cellulositrophicus]